MPTLDEHVSNKYVKGAIIGDSGTGKTGALTSLVVAGYELYILDMDNGLDSLKNYLRQSAPDRLSAVHYETIRDVYKMTASGPLCLNPKAFIAASKLATTWTDGKDPSELGEKAIFVVDSGSALGKAALEWARGMNPTAKEPRTWYFAAQQAIENLIALWTSENFHCNFLFLTHISYQQVVEGPTKGYPSTIGQALGPVINRYFNTLLGMEVRGIGTGAKRFIKTLPTGMLDLKSPVLATDLPEEVPIDTGLATIFEVLKGGKLPAKPKK